ncbi:MAG: anthranilate synthase component II [Candidatus Cloacimonadota bacterium]|nr:MAG: anthranilate synthase component II [Candidatus Cloacimonadota bacterium]PIE78702.1 MAG: anthranilate synthase component II [Candidatus Delongbacteria bacterium]
MNILLLDNNDSFTYNIVDLFRKFKNINLVVKSSFEDQSYLEFFDKFIISPGPGLPKDFPHIFEVIKYCEKNQKPLLGVCLGLQSIAQYFGGYLFRLENVVHGQKKEIQIIENSLLYKGLEKNIKVGLYHSWAVDTDKVPSCLKTTSLSKDNIIMSLEHKNLPIYGVQYHLESFLSKYGYNIVSNFLEI